MKKLFLLIALAASSAYAQTDDVNGDWKQKFILKQNTTEADYMIRYGDIDNLGFGWEAGFSPFSGISTMGHEWPMQRSDKTEFQGFDLAMVGSGYKKDEMGRDGYCGAKAYLVKNFKATTFEFKIPMKGIDSSKIKNVMLQIFVDDFQAKEFGSKFEFYLNRKQYAPAEKIINALRQTGPIGKLITIKITGDRVSDFKQDTLKILIDDKTTGIGDGFAIDFIKVLVNPKNVNKGSINGVLVNTEGTPLAGATVQYENQTVKTNAEGQFKLTDLPSGLVIVNVTTAEGKRDDISVDVENGKTIESELKFEGN